MADSQCINVTLSLSAMTALVIVMTALIISNALTFY